MASHEGSPRDDPVSCLKLTAYKDFPTNYPTKTSQEWLSGKRTDDDVAPYWRIHNKLYDFTEFVAHHPGGKTWLTVTRGTDITEAFESAHVSTAAEAILNKYYVKDISTARNSPYTFHEDGFYRTFKSRVQPILKKIGRGPSWKSLLIQDSLALSFIFMLLVAAALSSYTAAFLAGILLTLTINCAHNFLHQRYNWRSHYFDLSFFSSHEFRITHGLSHHLYTNTANDIEISMFEPFLEFLPKPDKTFLQRYGSLVYEIFLIPILPLYIETKTVSEIYTGKMSLHPEFILKYLELLVMALISPSIGMALKLFVVIHTTANVIFFNIGVTAAHHHPDIFHDGDRMRDDRDWGLCQLDAVRDRVEVTGNLLMVLTSFGEHTLHHLLPTVDHSKLHTLYPVFLKTCEEFKIPFAFQKWQSLVMGRYLQMANSTPNKKHPGYKPKTN